MFKTLRNAFKVKDIRDRILFTFLMLIIIRIGSELPAPGLILPQTKSNLVDITRKVRMIHIFQNYFLCLIK